MAGRVRVVSTDGRRGSVDAKDVASLPDNVRVLSQEEVAEEKLEADYAAQSTAQKVLGVAKFAGPAGAIANLAAGGGDAPPVVEAYHEAGRSSITAGIAPAAERVIRDKVAPGSGQAYAQRVDDLGTAFPTATTAGTVGGMVAGAAMGSAAAGGGAGVARIAPMNALAAAGTPIEHGVAKALGGLATKGALGKAATQGAAMAVRGAVEGAAYSGIEQASSDVLHDKPITGEKLFAAMGHGALAGGVIGGGLGFAGSLASSALGKAGKVASKRAGVAADLEALGISEAVPPPAGRETRLGGAATSAIDDVAASAAKMDVAGGARGLAHDQAWKAVGAGFGLQTTRYAKEAKKYFPGGTRELGEIALRYDAIDMGEAALSPTRAALQSAKTGTAAEIAPRLERALDEVGTKIGAITEASGARVNLTDIDKSIGRVRAEYDRIAGNEHVVSAIDGYHDSLRSKLAGSADGTASIQAALEQRKGLDEIVFRETKTLDPGRRVEALRKVRGELEGLITDALDGASGQVPGAQRAEYLRLKKDYHGLRILSEAAEDSAARSSKGATFGLTDKIIGGAAGAVGGLIGGGVGGLLSGPAAAFASKVVRERGNAAAAAFLSRAAEQGMITRAVEKVDALVGNAARTVLREGAAEGKGPAAASSKTQRQTAVSREQGRAQQAEKQAQARAIMEWHGQHQANPARLTQQIEEAAAVVGQHGGPKTAEAYTSSTLRAINFIVGHIPAKERRDPLDPRTTPPLTYEEADRLVRATKYATQPMTVWDDFARGKVTPEGIRAAKAFMPDTYVEFQGKLMEQVQDHMLRNKKLTASQRLRVDKLLEFPAGPDLRPDTIRRLQANLMKAPDPSGGAGAPPAAPLTGNPPVNMKVQESGFDAIEARASG